MSHLRDNLQNYAEARRHLLGDPGTKYASLEEVVLAHGVAPVDKLKAPSWATSTPKECFSNAALLAIGVGGYYTEGYLQSVIPIHHAWVTMPDGTIFDPTIDVGQERIIEAGADAYLGIPFDMAWFEKHLRKNRNYPCVMVTRSEMFNMDVLEGKFEVANVGVD